jgi:hypothetical protein
MSLRHCIFVLMAASACSATQAFEQSTHELITDRVLRKLTAKLTDGTQVKFSSQRRAEIAKQNADTDGRRFADARLHFDGEEFVSGAALARDNRNAVVSRVRTDSPNYLMVLGQLLHATQDFYSHSTWIEQGHGGGIASLSDAERDPKLLPMSQIGLVCDADATHVRGDKVSSGYFKLIRGFFNLIGWQHDDGPPPPGKCKHGLKNDDASLGINKDRPPTFDATGRLVDGSPVHDIAVELAEKATEDVLKKILKELEDARDDAALCRLMGDERNCSRWMYRFTNFISVPFVGSGLPYEESVRIRRWAINQNNTSQDVTTTTLLGNAGRAEVTFVRPPNSNMDIQLRACRRGDKWLPFIRSYSIVSAKPSTTFTAYNLVSSSCPTSPVGPGPYTAPFTVTFRLTEEGVLTVTRSFVSEQAVACALDQATGTVSYNEDVGLVIDLSKGQFDFHEKRLEAIDIRNNSPGGSSRNLLETSIDVARAVTNSFDITLTSGAFNRISGTPVESEWAFPEDCAMPLAFCPSGGSCTSTLPGG